MMCDRLHSNLYSRMQKGQMGSDPKSLAPMVGYRIEIFALEIVISPVISLHLDGHFSLSMPIRERISFQKSLTEPGSSWLPGTYFWEKAMIEELLQQEEGKTLEFKENAKNLDRITTRCKGKVVMPPFSYWWFCSALLELRASKQNRCFQVSMFIIAIRSSVSTLFSTTTGSRR